jgi:hypothetical protein
MMVARIHTGPTLRLIFSRADGHIESTIAVSGADARDEALTMLGRLDELQDGDRLTIRAEWR